MRFLPTRISDVVLVEPKVFGDSRGFFMETWQAAKFSQAGINAVFVQDNHSRSAKGILRGLHYQMKNTQGKLVRVISGEVFDVAVDLRKSSPTFGKWVGEVLSEKNRRMLWVPEGFAHGFYAMSDSVDFLYKCTDFYTPEHERIIRWDDPELAIDWPLAPGSSPELSARDAEGVLFRNAEYFP